MSISIRGLGLACVVLAAGCAFSEAAFADEFTLSSHPNGNQNPPPYGLRLDELLNSTGGHDVFTFDFDHADSDMRLSYNVTTGVVRIYGEVYGGRVVSDNYIAADSGLWEIDFTYDTNVTTHTSTHFEVLDTNQKGEDGNNTGFIKFLDASTSTINKDQVFDLVDYSKADTGLFFKLKDDNHRLNLGDDEYDKGYLIGRGWLGYGGDAYVTSTDWLFIAQPVPEPGTLGLLAMGLMGAGFVRRRRAARASAE